ncbi:MAG: hypothetical protein DRJ35_08575 [Thermoprotei archaeon]|nr:MAG: hypothetical protein DRJ35_08575 [Thermoprotei archaeon]
MDSKTIAVSAIFGTLWGVINFTISPYFFRLTHLPFFCDIIGLVSLFSAIWATRKLGTGTLTGIVATIITLMLRSNAFYFIGFTVASILLDIIIWFIGYDRVFTNKPIIYIPATSILVTAIGGLMIGAFFMNYKETIAILIWSALHAGGGLIASILVVPIIKALEKRLGKV